MSSWTGYMIPRSTSRSRDHQTTGTRAITFICKQMKKLVFATGNSNKVKEVNELLDGSFEVVSLKEIGFHEELPETSGTIEGNALQKARTLYQQLKVDCFSEDTGLEVDVLDGEPGVNSARYAGPDKSSEDNIDKLLSKLEGVTDRSARFRTVVALVLDGEEFLFEGIAEGEILKQRSGTGGFGYDPVFLPKGATKTFAEMGADEKNAISHRGKAIRKLISFLKNKMGN